MLRNQNNSAIWMIINVSWISNVICRCYLTYLGPPWVWVVYIRSETRHNLTFKVWYRLKHSVQTASWWQFGSAEKINKLKYVLSNANRRRWTMHECSEHEYSKLTVWVYKRPFRHLWSISANSFHWNQQSRIKFHPS